MRRTMRAKSRPLLLLAALGILLGACARPNTPVSVDLDRVLAAEPAATKIEVAIPSPPPPQPGVKVTQPGLPPETVPDPSTVGAESVRDLIRRQQHEARVQLEERLRQTYQTEVRQFQLAQERAQAQAELAQYAQANATIRQEFEAYGRKRGPLLADLTVLVGFPDPNPKSMPPSTPMGNVTRQQFDKAKALREQIHQLDADFDARVRAILGDVVAATEQERAALADRVKLFEDQMNQRAAAEASAQVREAVRSLHLQLARRTDVTVPAVSPRSVELPAQPALRPAPQVRSEGVLQSDADRKQLLRHQLRIWLGLNRYVLARDGRDVTEDFERWRKTIGAGL